MTRVASGLAADDTAKKTEIPGFGKAVLGSFGAGLGARPSVARHRPQAKLDAPAPSTRMTTGDESRPAQNDRGFRFYFSEAISTTKRYFTSLFSNRAKASSICCILINSISAVMPFSAQKS